MADSPATTYKKERKRGNPLIRRRERLKTSKRKKEGRKGEKIKKKKGGAVAVAGSSDPGAELVAELHRVGEKKRKERKKRRAC